MVRAWNAGADVPKLWASARARPRAARHSRSSCSTWPPSTSHVFSRSSSNPVDADTLPCSRTFVPGTSFLCGQDREIREKERKKERRTNERAGRGLSSTPRHVVLPSCRRGVCQKKKKKKRRQKTRVAATNSESDHQSAAGMLLAAILNVEDIAGCLGDVADIRNLHHKVEIAGQL